jgi:hypothetical protein
MTNDTLKMLRHKRAGIGERDVGAPTLGTGGGERARERESERASGRESERASERESERARERTSAPEGRRTEMTTVVPGTSAPRSSACKA